MPHWVTTQKTTIWSLTTAKIVNRQSFRCAQQFQFTRLEGLYFFYNKIFGLLLVSFQLKTLQNMLYVFMLYVSACKSLRRQTGMFIHNILTFWRFFRVFHVPSLEQGGNILKKQLTTIISCLIKYKIQRLPLMSTILLIIT